MPHPLVVSIPHALGKAEAVRRLKSGLGQLRGEYAALVSVSEEIWDGDQVTLQAAILKQHAKAVIIVGERRVTVELQLPWLLGRLAKSAQALIQQKGALMLERK
jgi:hypothetical protein